MERGSCFALKGYHYKAASTADQRVERRWRGIENQFGIWYGQGWKSGAAMLVMFCVSVYHRLDAECSKFVQLAGSFLEWGTYPVQPISHSYANLCFQKCVRSELGSASGFTIGGAFFFWVWLDGFVGPGWIFFCNFRKFWIRNWTKKLVRVSFV